MGVSVLILKRAVMSVSRTSGMTGMKVSKPAPMTVTFVTGAGTGMGAGGGAPPAARLCDLPLRAAIVFQPSLRARTFLFDRMFS